MTTPDRTAEAAFLAYRRDRSPEALASVYDRTASRLLAVALHLSSSAAAAEDAVQDTFLFALENPDRWDETRPLVPWLLGILGNRLKQSVHRARRTPDPARLRLVEPKDPALVLEADEVMAHIEHAIEGLAQPYRAVVLLSLRNGLSPADIAVALDRKPSTVRAQLTRGVEMLRKLLPVGIASLLVTSLVPGQGLAAVRAAVLDRAIVVERAFRGAEASELLRHVGLALTGCVALALTVWLVAPWLVATAAEPAQEPFAELDSEDGEVVHARPVELSHGRAAGAARREPVAPTGAVEVLVTSAGRSIGSANVRLQPLGDPPSAFVHFTSGSPGEWSVTVPGRPVPETEHRLAATGIDGRCTVDGLAAGHWLVSAVDTDEVVAVAPGAVVDLELRTQARIVRGAVVDGAGAAIAGASIWACRAHVERFTREVGRSDAQGRFEVAVAADGMIGARHEGRACVGVSVGRGAAPLIREVVLRLDVAGAAVTGRIVDERGEPVPGATVQVGHPADTSIVAVAGSPRVLARPVRVTADHAGRFRCAGLVPGETWLEARAPGFGVAGVPVLAAIGEGVGLTLALPRAATIVGTLRSAGGTPVPGASVQAGEQGSLAGCATTTNPDGSYRLTGITPGHTLVVVTDHVGGFAHTVEICRAGETVRWDPVFRADALQLSGRVLGRTGRPFANGWIVLRGLLGPRVRRLDAAGRFEFPVNERVAALPARVLVYDRDPRVRGKIVGMPLAVADGLAVGSRDIEIRLPAMNRPAWLGGRLVDEAGVLDSATVFLDAYWNGRRERIRIQRVDSYGAFRAGPLPPGRYAVSVEGQRLHRFGPFVVAAGEECDLGALRVPAEAAPASAQKGSDRFNRYLAFAWPGDVCSSEVVHVEIRDTDRRLFAIKDVARTMGGLTRTYVTLPAGRYVATATTPSGLRAVRELGVDAAPQMRAVLMALTPP